jgi:hypothetical protein
MKLTKEKYTKYELGLNLIIFIYYLFLVLGTPDSSKGVISIYFNVIVGYTIANIILVLFLMLITKSKSIGEDERDKIIESKAYRNGYIGAVSIINLVILLALVNDKILEPLIIFHILFSTLFISHIIQNITQIFYYKKGI